MKKRFTDCDIWADVWYRRLPVEYKEFWRYLCENCDNAGVWKIDDEAAAFHIGRAVDSATGLRLLNEGKARVAALPGDRLLVLDFIAFQYGTLSHDCNPHRGVFADIERNGLRLAKDCRRVLVPEAQPAAAAPPPPQPVGQDPHNEAGKGSPRPVEARKAPAAAPILPEWLPAAPWAAFVEMRAKIRKPLTGTAKTLIFKRLEALRAEGNDPEAVLNQSVMNSWQGVFPLREGPARPAAGGGGQRKSAQYTPVPDNGKEKAFFDAHFKGGKCSFCGEPVRYFPGAGGKRGTIARPCECEGFKSGLSKVAA